MVFAEVRRRQTNTWPVRVGAMPPLHAPSRDQHHRAPGGRGPGGALRAARWRQRSVACKRLGPRWPPQHDVRGGCGRRYHWRRAHRVGVERPQRPLAPDASVPGSQRAPSRERRAGRAAARRAPPSDPWAPSAPRHIPNSHPHPLPTSATRRTRPSSASGAAAAACECAAGASTAVSGKRCTDTHRTYAHQRERAAWRVSRAVRC